MLPRRLHDGDGAECVRSWVEVCYQHTACLSPCVCASALSSPFPVSPLFTLRGGLGFRFDYDIQTGNYRISLPDSKENEFGPVDLTLRNVGNTGVQVRRFRCASLCVGAALLGNGVGGEPGGGCVDQSSSHPQLLVLVAGWQRRRAVLL